jgi:protease I
MKILIAVAPEKYRDEELDGPLSALQKAGIGFDIASTRRGTCRGMLGATTTATLSFEEVDPVQYAGLIIIGGAGAPAHLWNDEVLLQLAKYFDKSGKVIAAICLAPVVFARAGALKGKKATFFFSPESFREMKKGGAAMVKEPVVTDGRIITADGPAAAKAFGDAVVKVLTTSPW